MDRLDDLARRSLTALVRDVRINDWSGRREREAISLYAMRHLVAEVRDDSVLSDRSQIGIEVPVPQLSGEAASRLGLKNPKKQVCRDLVIWPMPAMTCWDQMGQPTVPPLAIFQWKTARDPDPLDLRWLSEYSRLFEQVVGYAIALSGRGSHFKLRCTKVSRGFEARLDI